VLLSEHIGLQKCRPEANLFVEDDILGLYLVSRFRSPDAVRFATGGALLGEQLCQQTLTPGK
jgi:hypothetical protein